MTLAVDLDVKHQTKKTCFPIQEMKRQAGVEVNEEEELDYTEEEEDNGSSADNLQVFCCSATEYQKMKNISTDDGPPHVRHIYIL